MPAVYNAMQCATQAIDNSIKKWLGQFQNLSILPSKNVFVSEGQCDFGLSANFFFAHLAVDHSDYSGSGQNMRARRATKKSVLNKTHSNNVDA